MNRLGFYVENTTTQGLRDALRQVQPPVILLHAGDRGLLREIRGGLAPSAFVIGRLFVDLSEQERWLDGGNPEGEGRAFADRILNYDFGLARERGANGRLLVDAWMGLNESVRGPASWPSGTPDEATRRRYEALDRFQVAFRSRLAQDGVEAIAFNFGAGNYTRSEHYLEHFPRTLASYTYLGFHEYGWPTLMPRAGTATAALYYRTCMAGIRKAYGARHRVVVTEAGLARLYKYPGHPAGDVGWLYPGDTITEDQYWESLSWYNTELLKDEFVLGACLYQVGHGGRWDSFRHLGTDNAGRPLSLMARLERMRAEPAPPPPAPSPTPPPPTPSPTPPPQPSGTLLQRAAGVKSRMAAVVKQCDEFLSGVKTLGAAIDALVRLTEGTPTLGQLQAIQARLDAAETALRTPPAGIESARLRSSLSGLRTATDGLADRAAGARQVAEAVAQLRSELTSLQAKVPEVTALRQRAQGLVSEAKVLEAALQSGRAGPTSSPIGVASPEILDQRSMGSITTGAGRQPRELSSIRRLIVHHSGTRADASPAAVLDALRAGPDPIEGFHYLVGGDGRVHYMQAIETALRQTGAQTVDAESIAVCLVGNFHSSAPSEPQLDSAASVLAWLLATLGLDAASVVGRKEIDAASGSPGSQWLEGLCYRGQLLGRIGVLLGSDAPITDLTDLEAQL